MARVQTPSAQDTLRPEWPSAMADHSGFLGTMRQEFISASEERVC